MLLLIITGKFNLTHRGFVYKILLIKPNRSKSDNNTLCTAPLSGKEVELKAIA